MKEGGVGKPRLLCSLGQGKGKKKRKKRKKDKTNRTELQRETEKRSLGTEKDVKVIKENKTNNKIR